MVFLLLIFFLVATRFEEEERSLDVDLPAASVAMPLTVRPKELFVNVDKDGRFVVAQKELKSEQLHEVLKRAAETNPGRQTVIIRADKRVAFQHVVTVMDLCKKVGIQDCRWTTAAEAGP
jgi:biopolymer transport protein ExbD